MNRSNDIRKELQDLDSVLADMPRLAPFALPENYLPELSDRLAAGTMASEREDPLPAFPTAAPFEVPQAYFETLPEILTQSAIGDALRPKSARFDIPDDYFENLPHMLLARVKEAERPAARSVEVRPSWGRSAIRWAAAAMLVIGLAVGTYTYMQIPTADGKATRELAKLGNDIISSYVGQHLDEFDSELLESMASTGASFDKSVPALDDREIMNYLEDAESVDSPNLH